MRITALMAAVSAVALSSAAMAQDSFTIGLSNGFVGSEWRTQMIAEAEAAAAAWADRGVTVDVVVQSANVDVQGQIGHVRNFINQGVDAIEESTVPGDSTSAVLHAGTSLELGFKQITQLAEHA